MDLDEVFEENWGNRTNESLHNVKNDVLCTISKYDRDSKGIEGITGLGMKSSMTLPSLGWKNFNSLREHECDEKIYT